MCNHHLQPYSIFLDLIFQQKHLKLVSKHVGGAIMVWANLEQITALNLNLQKKIAKHK